MSTSHSPHRIVFAVLVLVSAVFLLWPETRSIAEVSPTAALTPEERGLHNLTHNPYGMFLLTDKLLERLPMVWEAEWKAKVNANDPASLRQVAFARYGFSEATWDNHGGPMQMVVSDKGCSCWCPALNASWQD